MDPRRTLGAAVAVAASLLAVACGDTSDPPAESPTSPSTSTTAEPSSATTVIDSYQGEFEGKDAAGTDGGDANPDAEDG